MAQGEVLHDEGEPMLDATAASDPNAEPVGTAVAVVVPLSTLAPDQLEASVRAERAAAGSVDASESAASLVSDSTFTVGLAAAKPSCFRPCGDLARSRWRVHRRSTGHTSGTSSRTMRRATLLRPR